jgi:hypothetical protein
MNETDHAHPAAATSDDLGVRIENQMDPAFRSMLGHGPEVVRQAGFLRLITGEPHCFGNFAFVSDQSVLTGAMDAIEPLCHCGAPAAVLAPQRLRPQIDDQLRQRGFALDHPMPAMAVEIDRLDDAGLPADCTLVRIGGNPAEHEAWARAFADGFELPLPVSRAFAPRAGDVDPSANAPAQYFAIARASQFIATTMLYLDDGLAGLYCVSTIPSERRRGLARSATVATLRRALPLGYTIGVLQSSPAGHSIYRRLGFREYGNVLMYVRGT